MVILKYKEHLLTSPKEAMWVYDLCPQMPEWDEKAKDYVCKKEKRIDAVDARRIIKENGLKCVHSDENGKIYK